MRAIPNTSTRISAAFCLIWDHLFGTYQAELPKVKIRYGLAHPRSSENPFIIAYEDLWRMLKEVFTAPAGANGSTA